MVLFLGLVQWHGPIDGAQGVCQIRPSEIPPGTVPTNALAAADNVGWTCGGTPCHLVIIIFPSSLLSSFLIYYLFMFLLFYGSLFIFILIFFLLFAG